MSYDATIIGGGISGLSTAYDLAEKGYNVVVLERQQMVGGNAISQNINGFLMEHGPTTINAMVPQARELAVELGLGNELVDLGSGIAKRYLRDGKKLHSIDIGPAGFFRSPYLSLAGRALLATEGFRGVRKGKGDESVHDFASRRFGVEFAEKVIDPLAAGMFGGDAKRLSMRSAFPALLELEQKHGSITRGIIKSKRGSEPAKRLFSFKSGVASLPKALAQKLGPSIQTGVAVTSVCQTEFGYKIKTSGHSDVHTKSVIVAVQPHVASQLLENIDQQSASAISQIDAPPMSIVFQAYERRQVGHLLDSLGFLSVKNCGGVITGAQFYSTMFGGRAPAGYVAVGAYVGGVRNRQAAMVAPDELEKMVHEELAQLLDITGQPVLSRCRQWARSLPQYEIGHTRKLEILQSTPRRNAGLFLAGNYLAGVSIANCIGQARSTAQSVDAFLQTRVTQAVVSNVG